MNELLIPIGTVEIAATTTPFIACDHFVRNIEKNAPVKIFCLGNNFKEWFLGKTEAPFGGSTLRYGKPFRSLVDDPIIAELGGNEKAETTLIELFLLMQAQPNGKSGPLLTDNCANIFYIKDVSGVLRSVCVSWDVDGWYVFASAVTNQYEWNDDDQVFSRDSRSPSVA